MLFFLKFVFLHLYLHQFYLYFALFFVLHCRREDILCVTSRLFLFHIFHTKPSITWERLTLVVFFGLDSMRCNLYMCFRSMEKHIISIYLFKIVILYCMISCKELLFSHWPNSSWCIFFACKDKLGVLIVCTKVRVKARSCCMQKFLYLVLMRFVQDFCFSWVSHKDKPLTT